LECKPICVKQTGVVSSKVSDKLCAGAPQDQCACKCYHDAQWTCDDESGRGVVCKARFGAGKLETVGDKVCEMRGAEKPESTAELRVASACEPVKEMRGSAPVEECLEQWATTPAPAAEKDATDEHKSFIMDQSFAPAFASAALFALYA
jgi:hypothetical protein